AFSFDASVFEFYAPLNDGARLIMARPDEHQDPEYLIKVIREQEVTVLQCVPSQLRAMLEQKEMATCKSLHTLFSGGEELAAELAMQLTARLGANLYNLYGPTEAAIVSTYWKWEGAKRQRAVPIGRPI